MTLKNASDTKGRFWQYDHGMKYHYPAGHPKARLNAKKKAIKQAVAIAYRTTGNTRNLGVHLLRK